MPSTECVKDEELSSSEEEVINHHDNKNEYGLPVEFVAGAEGLVTASQLPANKVFGPYQGSVIKVDPEGQKINDEEDQVILKKKSLKAESYESLASSTWC